MANSIKRDDCEQEKGGQREEKQKKRGRTRKKKRERKKEIQKLEKHE